MRITVSSSPSSALRFTARFLNWSYLAKEIWKDSLLVVAHVKSEMVSFWRLFSYRCWKVNHMSYSSHFKIQTHDCGKYKQTNHTEFQMWCFSLEMIWNIQSFWWGQGNYHKRGKTYLESIFLKPKIYYLGKVLFYVSPNAGTRNNKRQNKKHIWFYQMWSSKTTQCVRNDARFGVGKSRLEFYCFHFSIMKISKYEDMDSDTNTSLAF